MMCYKDKTFCTFYEKCTNGKECNRALTPIVQQQAEKWWGNKDVPINVYSTKPECFKEIKNKQNEE